MDSLLQFEVEISLLFQALGSWLLLPMKFFTFLGTENFFLLVIPALYWCIDSILGLRIGVMLMLTGWFNSLLKIIFLSPRPYWFDARVLPYSSETSFGVPSGHAQNSAAVFGLFGVSLRKRWAVWVSAALILMVGLSRIYLGVHFTRDVLVGWIIGFLLVALFLWLEKPLAGWFQRQSLVIQVLTSLLAAVVITGSIAWVGTAQASVFSMPSEWLANATRNGLDAPDPLDISGGFTLGGTIFGLAAGFFLFTNKHGLFNASGSPVEKVLRYFVGAFGVILLWFGLGAVFPRNPDLTSYLLRFLRYTLIGLWVTWAAPLLFLKLKIAKHPVK